MHGASATHLWMTAQALAIHTGVVACRKSSTVFLGKLKSSYFYQKRILDVNFSPRLQLTSRRVHTTNFWLQAKFFRKDMKKTKWPEIYHTIRHRTAFLQNMKNRMVRSTFAREDSKFSKVPIICQLANAVFRSISPSSVTYWRMRVRRRAAPELQLFF